jgi:hypothetical protein
MIQKHFHLPAEICAKLAEAAKRERRSQSSLVELILLDALPQRTADWHSAQRKRELDSFIEAAPR